MPASQWRPDTGVVAELFAHPHRFEFFQAVSLLHRWLRGRGVSASRIFDDCLRFGNRLSLSFPPSQLAAVNLIDDQLSQVRVVPAFLSLLGSTGAMPLHYTERIAAYERTVDGGGGPRAFLDLLSTRSVALFYQGWTRHRAEHMVAANGEDGFLVMLSALAGAPAMGVDKNGGLDNEVAARYAAQLGCRSVPASMVADVLADYFQVPIVLRQLIAHWETLPPPAQARLGRHHVALSAGVLPGTRIYQRSRRAELRIGPLSDADLQRFLPGEHAARAMSHLRGLFCGAGVDFIVRLLLRREDVVACRLPGIDGGGPRLGINAFLPEEAAARDRDDLRYLIQS